VPEVVHGIRVRFRVRVRVGGRAPEVVHGVAEQRVLVAVEVAVSRAVERLRACAEARGAPALHRPVHLVRVRVRLRVRVRVRVRVRSALSTSPSTHEALR